MSSPDKPIAMEQLVTEERLAERTTGTEIPEPPKAEEENREWQVRLHGKELLLTLIAIVGGAVGLFQWGHMIGESGLDELRVVHLGEVGAARHEATEDLRELQSQSRVYLERIAALDSQVLLLQERITNSETLNSAMKEELQKRGVSLAELSRMNRELSEKSQQAKAMLEKDRPLFNFSIIQDGQKVIMRPKNISAVAARITRSVSGVWIDGRAGKGSSSDNVSIQQPGGDSYYFSFSAAGMDGELVASGLADFRMAACIEYETLTNGDSRKWMAEFWAVSDGSTKQFFISREDDSQLKSGSNGCNLSAQMPTNWVVDASMKKERAVQSLLSEGKALAIEGRVNEALAKYSTIVTRYSVSAINSWSWNTLCWNGALRGFPKEVMFACNNAIGSATDEDKIHFLDSRAIARSLAGDLAGARVDLESVLKLAESRKTFQAYVPIRRSILDALRQGYNPVEGELKDRLLLE